MSLVITNVPGGTCSWERIGLDNWPDPIRIENNAFFGTNAYSDEYSGTFAPGLRVAGALRSQDPSAVGCDSGRITWEAAGTMAAEQQPAPQPPASSELAPGRPAAAAPIKVPTPAPTRTAEQIRESCSEDGRFQFDRDLIQLKQRLGDVVGDPGKCPDRNLANHDILQQTTTGLAYFRWHSALPTFTDGWRHWALRHDGQLVMWEGESPDPV